MCTMQVVLPYKNGIDTDTLGNKFLQHKLFTSHPPLDNTINHRKDSGISSFLRCDFTILSMKNLLWGKIPVQITETIKYYMHKREYATFLKHKF